MCSVYSIRYGLSLHASAHLGKMRQFLSLTLLVAAQATLGTPDMIASYKSVLTSRSMIREARANLMSDESLLVLLSSVTEVPAKVAQVLKPKDAEEKADDTLAVGSIMTRILPVIESTDSFLIEASTGLHCIIDRLSDSILVSDFVRPERQESARGESFDSINLPLYMALSMSEFRESNLEDPAVALWLNILRQVHYRSVLIHAATPNTEIGEAFRRFSIVGRFCLETLVAMTADAASAVAEMPGIPLGHGVEIPPEVVTKCVDLGWYCLGRCLDRLRGTTTTTTTTQAPTPDPADEAKKRDELLTYITKVNGSIDKLNEKIGALRRAHASGDTSEAFLDALDELKETARSAYSQMLMVAMGLKYNKEDISATKSQFDALLAKLGEEMNPMTFGGLIDDLRNMSAALRSELLEAAMKL